MNGEDSPPESDSSADPTYDSHFRRHLAEVRAHLAGVDGEDLLPSYIPPTGYWTPSEKNTFFHSLSVYSRLRPDLVAACIGTKTVLDVCAYIDSLDEAVSRDKHLLCPRSELKGAMEMSKAWVRREEKMAEELISVEPQWDRHLLLQQREEEVSAKEAQFQAAAVDGEVDLKGLGTWEHDRRRHWAREDTLQQLDRHHLTVLERILKENESGDLDMEDAAPDDQESAGPAPLPPAPSSTQSPDRTSDSSVHGDGMFDPVLLPSSGLPAPGQSSHEKLPPQGYREPLLPTDSAHPLKGASIPPAAPAPAPLQPISYARSPTPEVEQEVTVDPSDLSPASRRRFRKRLYMRRKRAAQKGEEAVDLVARLRPGRKAKERKVSEQQEKTTTAEPGPLDLDEGEDALMDVDQNAGATALPHDSTQAYNPPRLGGGDDEEDEEEEDDEEDPTPGRRPKISGLTKPYKAKRLFESQGINVDTLLQGDLGFFQYSTLSRLVTQPSGYGTKSSNVATSISADTIRLMSAILVEFTTEVVQRTIISREQENNMKGGIKAYRHVRDEISIENVEHVLEMMGMEGPTKEKHEMDDDEELAIDGPEDDDEASDEDASHGEDDDDNDLPCSKRPTIFPALLPLHRECHPPLIHLPKSLTPHTQNGSGAITAADEFLMPVDTNEEELLEELEAEMDLDDADRVIEYEYEADLWKQFGRV